MSRTDAYFRHGRCWKENFAGPNGGPSPGLLKLHGVGKGWTRKRNTLQKRKYQTEKGNLLKKHAKDLILSLRRCGGDFGDI